MRSKLFVPGARPELFAKAMAGDADAVSFDLEDSVPPDGKAQARADVVTFLRGGAALATGKRVIVRLNAPDTRWFEEDLAQLAVPGVALLNIPKLEEASAVQAVVRRLVRVETANAVATPICLLINIETPAALANAAALARAPRVAGLQLGLGDLFAPLGIARTHDNVQAAMFAVRMAAAQAGVFACDGAWPDVADESGFLEEAKLSQKLGFIGKSCIHPRQVALAHSVFTIDPQMLIQARRVVAAARDAQTRGHGAFLVDGRMIDAPYLARARALLAQAGENENS